MILSSIELSSFNLGVLAFGASAGAIFAVQQAFSHLVKSTIDVEKKLAEINVVLGTSQKSLKSFGAGLFDAAAQAGMGFSAAAEAATEFSRQGLGLEKTLSRVNDALVLSRLTGLSVADSVNAITAAINGYNLSLKEQENLTSRIIAVDQAFAVSGADIAEAMRRVASTAQGAGVSLNELISIVTAAQQKTARGGAVIGNSFKTIFTRLQRPRTLEALDQLGIKVKDASGAMLPAMQVLSNLAKQFDGLTHAQKSNVAQLVGGVFQINVLKAAIGYLSSEYSIYGNALQIANSATDEANQRNAELNKTMAAQLNALVQNVTKVAAAFGDLTIAPALEKIVSGLNALLSETPEGEAEGMGSKIGKGILRGIGNVLSGPGLLMLGVALFKLFQFLGKQAKDAVSTIMQMGKATEKRMALENKVLETLSREPEILEKINKGEMSIAKLHDDILKDIQQENTLLIAQEKIAKNIATSLSGRTVLTTSGSGAALAPKPRRSAGYIPNYADQLEMERREAMRRGASPRVRGYYDPKVKIKGKRGAIVNTEEDVIHNFRGGESAVLPRYNQGINSALFKRRNVKSSGINPKGIPAKLPPNVYGVVSVKGTPTADHKFTQAELKSKGFKNVTGDVIVSGIGQYRPQSYKLDGEQAFQSVADEALGEAAGKISKSFIGETPKELPDPERLGRIISSDTSAYPQMAGRIFEAALSAVLKTNKALDTDANGNRRWDFKKGDFNRRRPFVEAVFGDDAPGVLNTSRLDSKFSVDSRSYKESMNKKLANSQMSKRIIQQAIDGANLRKAQGYIPNFASGLSDAIGREHDAGIPYNQMRIHTAADGHPIAVTNKKDEPNGLKDVRRMNGGYIPNFAAPAPPAMGPVPAVPTTEYSAGAADREAEKTREKMRKAGDRAVMAGVALSMLTPAISNMAGAGKTATDSLNSAVTAIGAGAMVFSMMPNKIGAIIGATVALGAAMHSAAKYLSTKHLERFSKAAETGKENLERFNASSQAASQAMSDLDAELKKAVPDAKRVMSFQRAYGKALSELPPALRRQIMSSKNLSEAQEALAKAQMEAIRLQKGREAAAQLSTSMASKTGFSNAYGRFSEDSSGLDKATGAAIITGMGAAIGAAIGGIAGFFGGGGVSAAPGAGLGFKVGGAAGAAGGRARDAAPQ